MDLLFWRRRVIELHRQTSITTVHLSEGATLRLLRFPFPDTKETLLLKTLYIATKGNVLFKRATKTGRI